MKQEKKSDIILAFVGKEKNNFRPSINLTEETFEGSQKEYIELIKKELNNNPIYHVKQLSNMDTKLGKAKTFLIQAPSPYGTISMIQTISFLKNKAFVMTAAVLEKEFIKANKEIFYSMSSLRKNK